MPHGKIITLLLSAAVLLLGDAIGGSEAAYAEGQSPPKRPLMRRQSTRESLKQVREDLETAWEDLREMLLNANMGDVGELPYPVAPRPASPPRPPTPVPYHVPGQQAEYNDDDDDSTAASATVPLLVEWPAPPPPASLDATTPDERLLAPPPKPVSSPVQRRRKLPPSAATPELQQLLERRRRHMEEEAMFFQPSPWKLSVAQTERPTSPAPPKEEEVSLLEPSVSQVPAGRPTEGNRRPKPPPPPRRQ